MRVRPSTRSLSFLIACYAAVAGSQACSGGGGGSAPQFSIVLEPAIVRVHAGESRSVTVRVIRESAPTDVTVTVEDLPAGMVAGPATFTLGATSTSGTIVFGAAPSALPIGPVAVTVRARSGRADETAALEARIFPQGGTLDTTFSADGKTATRLGYDIVEGRGVIVNAAGEIIAVGEATTATTDFVTAMKLLPAGSLDTTYGPAGGSGSIGLELETVARTAPQPDGSIIISGSLAQGGPGPASYHFGMVRVLPGGTKDSSFGIGGQTMQVFPGGDSYAYGMAFLPDGRILLVGNSYGPAARPAMARFDEDGLLDATFGSAGVVLVVESSGNLSGCTLQAVAMRPGGGFVVAGFGSGRPFIAGFMEDGDLDTTFGGGGITFLMQTGSFQDIAVGADGSIVAAGIVNGTSAVVGFTPDGDLDPGFGASGLVFGPGIACLTVHVDADGGVYCGGSMLDAAMTSTDMMVMKLLADGSADPYFGVAGVVSLDLYGLADLALGLALQPDGMLLVTGTTVGAPGGPPTFGSISGFAVVRMFP